MPQVSRFYGLLIYFYYNEHNPPHFHAHYGESKCEIGINDLRILAGSLPNRAYALVLEWAALHRNELMNNWNLARDGKPLQSIEPLP